MLTLASDHLLIIISIEKPPDFITVNNPTLVNFNKTNRAASQNSLRTPLHRTTNSYRRNCWRKSIPQSYCCYRSFHPRWKNCRNPPKFLSRSDTCHPYIRDPNLEIRQLINQYKRTKWVEHVKSCNLSAGVRKLWATVKSPSNPRRHDDLVKIHRNKYMINDE